MQTREPDTWDPRVCRRLVLLTDNSAAWRFRAQLATKDFAVMDCRGAPISAVHDELARLQPDLIAISLRDPQRFVPTILDYATAYGRAGYCLFWAGPQQWLRGLDPQLPERLEESRPSTCSEWLAMKDAVSLARLLFITHQEQGPVCVDLADVGAWLASGGRHARVVVKSIYIRNPPERRDFSKRLHYLQRELTDVRGACFCLEGRHNTSMSEFDAILDAMHDSVPESALIIVGIPIHAARACELKMRLVTGFAQVAPGSQRGELTLNGATNQVT